MKYAIKILFLFVFLSNFIFAESSRLASYTYNLQKGWNLIGITLEPTAESKQELLNHDIYDFNGDIAVKAYCRSSDVVAGKSYWIYSEANESLAITGTQPGSILPDTPGVQSEHLIAVGSILRQVSEGEVTVTAPAKEGYTFTNWTVDGVSIADTTQETVTFTMPSNNVLLGTNYSLNSYKLTVDGEEKQVDFGEEVTVTAVEKEGKTFGGWWNIAGVSGIENSQTISFTMPANDVSMDSYYYDSGEYLVVNLETGENRVSSTGPDLSDDVCRTTELWLRKIPKGSFIMGSPTDEVGRDSDETQHQVTLTEDFYIGVFEMTQRQYELITGDRPSFFNNAIYYAPRPVESVSYDMIRGSSVGAGWPVNNDVDSDSFLGKLRTKTGLVFELPTEGQWEFACRAGTTTSLNTGKNVYNPYSPDANLNAAGRNWYNGGSAYSQSCDTTAGTSKVGSYLPNAWGLYDMHGNVWEWCLDWFDSYPGDVTDPAGAVSGSIRVHRGGSWISYEPRTCRSANRGSGGPSLGNGSIGFRVVCLSDRHTLSINGEDTLKKVGEVVSVTAEEKVGYTFTGWTVTGVTVDEPTANPLEFIMPANHVALTANYTVSNYKLTVNGVEEQVSYGTAVSRKASSKEGHTFTGWTVTGVTVADATADLLEFTMPAGDVTLVANYSVNSYTLTVDGAEEQVSYGTAVSKTAPSKKRRSFTGWTVTGVTVPDATANPLEFTMPGGDVTLISNYEEDPKGGTYLVVYLEDNAQAGVKAWDSKFTETAPDISDDSCRTRELWLRRIPKGTFTMGSPADELGRESDETQHQVTLTEDFYIGVFEMTQRQYELITGEKPSYFNNASCYATRPVEKVSYEMIRGAFSGAGWPANSEVDSNSFLGKLYSKTGIDFELPTEGQWEYACRAGTTTSLNTGKDVVNLDGPDDNMNEAGRNWYNGGSEYSQACDTTAGTMKVGSYLPNAWGLYDMHGNVAEWCRDWYGPYSGDATDPVGAQSGSDRVLRGDGWDGHAQDCRSAMRLMLFSAFTGDSVGFRLVYQH